MVDQKALREMMKKEKEQRAAATKAKAGQRPRTGQVAAAPPSRSSMPPTAAPSKPATPSAPSKPAAAPAPAAPAKTGGLVGGYGDSDSDEEPAKEPVEKKARVEDSSAMPPPPVPAKKNKEQADSALMPPPAIPGLKKSSAATLPSRPVEPEPAEEEPDVGPEPPPAEDMQIVPAPEGALARSDGNDTAAEGEQGEEEEKQPTLPVGFFDDPEKDAKARGVEAPSVVAQRELEEGLKKFEKEMQIEREKAEEARNELEEDRHLEKTAEEEEIQNDLKGRLEALRKRKLDIISKNAAAPKPEESKQEAEAAGEDDADDSGSDIDFDWRAKDFG